MQNLTAKNRNRRTHRCYRKGSLFYEGRSKGGNVIVVAEGRKRIGTKALYKKKSKEVRERGYSLNLMNSWLYRR